MAVLLAKVLRLDAKLREVFTELEEEVERDVKIVEVLEKSLKVLDGLRISKRKAKAETIRSRSGSIIAAARQHSTRGIAFTNPPVSDESRFAHMTPRTYGNSYTNGALLTLPKSAMSGKLAQSATALYLPPKLPKQTVPKLVLGASPNSPGMGSGPKARLLELEHTKFEQTYQKLQNAVSEASKSSTMVVSSFDVFGNRRPSEQKPSRGNSAHRQVGQAFTSSTGGLNRRNSEPFDRSTLSRHSSKSASRHYKKGEFESLRKDGSTQNFNLTEFSGRMKLPNQKDTIQEISKESSGFGAASGLHSMRRNASKNSAEGRPRINSLTTAERLANGLNTGEIDEGTTYQTTKRISRHPTVPSGTPAEGMSRNNSGVRNQHVRESQNNHRSTEIELSERGPEKVSSLKVSGHHSSEAKSGIGELPERMITESGREFDRGSNLDSTGGMAGLGKHRPKLPRSNFSLGIESSPVLVARESEVIKAGRISAHATLVGIANMLSENAPQRESTRALSPEQNFVMQSFDPFASKFQQGPSYPDSNVDNELGS